MQGVLIFLIILFVVFPLARMAWQRWVQPWLIRRAARKMEDYLRAAAGMPPRDEGARSKKRGGSRGGADASGSRGRGDASGSRRGRTKRQAPQWEGPLIPKEYAVDVEYVEIKEYSATVEIRGEGKSRADGSRRVVVESQVSDVEYVEIRMK